ncbi:hypothetical protein Landi51_07346 [Colletotrichum acutatum]
MSDDNDNDDLPWPVAHSIIRLGTIDDGGLGLGYLTTTGYRPQAPTPGSLMTRLESLARRVGAEHAVPLTPEHPAGVILRASEWPPQAAVPETQASVEELAADECNRQRLRLQNSRGLGRRTVGKVLVLVAPNGTSRPRLHSSHLSLRVLPPLPCGFILQQRVCDTFLTLAAAASPFGTAPTITAFLSPPSS